MHPLLGARVRAYLVDSLVWLTVPVALVPVGLLVRRHHPDPDLGLLYVLSFVPPVTATLFAAVQESGPGTWGHRSQGLVVLTSDGATPTLRRALVRNLLKVGVPWQLGHVVAIGAATDRLDRDHPWTIAATAVTYLWAAAAAGAVALGPGRGVHDRVTGTRVVAGRR